MNSSASCYSHFQQLWKLKIPRLRHEGIWGTRGSAPLIRNFNTGGWCKIRVTQSIE